jgi:predicted alpha/beta superfamily hydrolase
MLKIVALCGALFFLSACQQASKQKATAPTEGYKTEVLYSSAVKDSFYISVCLPDGYDEANNTNYPVVYLTDANFHFDILAPLVKIYAMGGLMPQVILIGIGYKDFGTMDSLRYRDYTHPIAFAEYEMALSGEPKDFILF